MKPRLQSRTCEGPYLWRKEVRPPLMWPTYVSSSLQVAASHTAQQHDPTCLSGKNIKHICIRAHPGPASPHIAQHSKLVHALVLTSFRSHLLPRHVPITIGFTRPWREATICVTDVPPYMCTARSTPVLVQGKPEEELIQEKECTALNEYRCWHVKRMCMHPQRKEVKWAQNNGYEEGTTACGKVTGHKCTLGQPAGGLGSASLYLYLRLCINHSV